MLSSAITLMLDQQITWQDEGRLVEVRLPRDGTTNLPSIYQANLFSFPKNNRPSYNMKCSLSSFPKNNRPSYNMKCSSETAKPTKEQLKYNRHDKESRGRKGNGGS
eukprot:Phypoly_transcript_10536.p1 GENE.Phypoly_transcript_10536~~Phypoly_transcript_10536.p1  ORF type:complete len:106 (-),score=8.11 Phypoly_transcript_10536:393-710(-)